MTFPAPDLDLLRSRLEYPSGRLRVVMDCDTDNEVDDQFAIAHALLCPERFDIRAIYAAPFSNERSSAPEDGMEKSYRETLRVLEALDPVNPPDVLRGSRRFMADRPEPVNSDAAEHLVQLARESDLPLYVVATAAATDVASAILLAPEIIRKIVVVWLGGHALGWPHAREFNLSQDPNSARVLLDSGVPLILIPCLGVASHMLLGFPGLQRDIGSSGPVGRLLTGLFESHGLDRVGYEKEIWDLAATAWLADPAFVRAEVVPSPILAEDLTWRFESSRHPVRSASWVARNAIFQDLFNRIRRQA